MSNAAYPVIDALCGIDGASPQISQYTKDFNKIKFMLGNNLEGYTLMIVTDINGHVEIVKTDGVNLIQGKDKTTGETSLLWNIGSNITVSHGVVVYQIVGYRSQNGTIVSTWYSKEGRLLVTESIDTTTYSAELMGSHPNLITQLIAECTEVRTECEQKVDKVDGKGLSSCDFTPDEKEKLATVSNGANPNVQANWSETDESSDAYIKNKPEIDGEVGKTSNLVTNFAVATKFEEVAEDTTKEIHTATQEAKDYTSQVQEELHNHINETYGLDKKHLTSEELEDVKKIPKILDGTNAVPLAEVAWNADKAYADEKDNVIHDTYLPRHELEERIPDTTAFNPGWTVAERAKYLCTMYTIGEILDGGLQVGFARVANEADRTHSDYFNNAIHETYATKEELYPTTVITPPATLSANTSYEFGTLLELVLSFPTNANNGDVIYISFLSRDTATNLTIDTTNTTDIDLVPETNTGYEIYAKYNMSFGGWIVKYSEYDI